jgi:predicted extracellular nuclease
MSYPDFRVGTFNVYNLALPELPFHRYLTYTLEEYQKKKRWISLQLERMEADVVGFQEVIHKQALQEIVAEVEGYKKAQIIVAETKDQKPTVAFLSKFPILSTEIFTHFPPNAQFNVQGVDIPFTKFSKPVLCVKVALSKNLQCTFFVVHLKSKAPIWPKGCDPNDPEERAKGIARALILRTAEATALRMILLQTLQKKTDPVIVMGDVNDGGLAVTSQIITGDPPRQHFGFEQKQQFWDVLLYSVKDIQERQSHEHHYYSYIHHGHYESLDHILVSQEWIAQNPQRIGKVIYVSVLNDHLIDDTLSDEKVKKWHSDHGQVVATFRLNT